MKTLEQLERRQQKELIGYQLDREKRLDAFVHDQRELVSLCIGLNGRGHDMLKNLLHEQRQAFDAMENDDFDMLKHIHSLERESHIEKLLQRDKLANELSEQRDRDKDRGR